MRPWFEAGADAWSGRKLNNLFEAQGVRSKERVSTS